MFIFLLNFTKISANFTKSRNNAVKSIDLGSTKKSIYQKILADL